MLKINEVGMLFKFEVVDDAEEIVAGFQGREDAELFVRMKQGIVEAQEWDDMLKCTGKKPFADNEARPDIIIEHGGES